jgi:hypothetical protein
VGFYSKILIPTLTMVAPVDATDDRCGALVLAKRGREGQHPVSSSSKGVKSVRDIHCYVLTIVAPVDATDDRCGAPIRAREGGVSTL